LHRKNEKHYPTCNSVAELRNSFANFFSEKIVAIRQEIDDLPNAYSINQITKVQ
jgi:5-carboxymethyl-2-hydroxymuconate isomerase